MVAAEWALSTTFPTNDTFLRQWGDTQKLAYSQGAGWMFWNWKVDPDAKVPQQKMWSYRDALAGGVITPKPDQYFDRMFVRRTFHAEAKVRHVSVGRSHYKLTLPLVRFSGI